MNNLSDVFDMIPVEVILPAGKSITVVEPGDENADHLYARAKHYELAERGSEALDIAMKIAKETENPRAIEVLSGLIKSLSDVNKALLNLNKDKYEASSAKHTPGHTSVGQAVQTQNIIFAGNSRDLNKMIADSLKSGE